MPKGVKYKLSESPLYYDVACSSSFLLRFYFTTEVRQRSFMRRLRDYRDQVDTVINSRYHGLHVYADEIAAIDLYNRIETGEERIEELVEMGSGYIARPLTPGKQIVITAVLE